jgi:hypothetical protein
MFLKNTRIFFCALMLLLSMLMVNLATVGIAQTSETVDVPRNEAVWMMGYWQSGTSSMNPLIDPASVSSGVIRSKMV